MGCTPSSSVVAEGIVDCDLLLLCAESKVASCTPIRTSSVAILLQSACDKMVDIRCCGFACDGGGNSEGYSKQIVSLKKKVNWKTSGTKGYFSGLAPTEIEASVMACVS